VYNEELSSDNKILKLYKMRLGWDKIVPSPNSEILFIAGNKLISIGNIITIAMNNNHDYTSSINDEGSEKINAW
jgi:hypothetical protein